MGTQPFKRTKTEELREQIIEFYKAGVSFRKMSKLLNISHETARKIWKSTTLSQVMLTQVDSGDKVNNGQLE